MELSPTSEKAAPKAPGHPVEGLHQGPGGQGGDRVVGEHGPVFLHVAVSVGWMGAGAANVVLAATAASTTASEVSRVCYFVIDRIDVYLVIPSAFAALASGVLLSLVTPWGLARYRWVLVKLVLTVVVIVYSAFGVGLGRAEHRGDVLRRAE